MIDWDRHMPALDAERAAELALPDRWLPAVDRFLHRLRPRLTPEQWQSVILIADNVDDRLQCIAFGSDAIHTYAVIEQSDALAGPAAEEARLADMVAAALDGGCR